MVTTNSNIYDRCIRVRHKGHCILEFCLASKIKTLAKGILEKHTPGNSLGLCILMTQLISDVFAGMSLDNITWKEMQALRRGKQAN